MRPDFAISSLCAQWTSITAAKQTGARGVSHCGLSPPPTPKATASSLIKLCLRKFEFVHFFSGLTSPSHCFYTGQIFCLCSNKRFITSPLVTPPKMKTKNLNVAQWPRCLKFDGHNRVTNTMTHTIRCQNNFCNKGIWNLCCLMGMFSYMVITIPLKVWLFASIFLFLKCLSLEELGLQIDALVIYSGLWHHVKDDTWESLKT